MSVSDERHERFVEEYIIDRNATQAAIRAGYSPKTAGASGSRLLRNVNIAKAIKDAQQRMSERCKIKADDVLNGISRCTQKAEEAEDYRTALKGYELQGKHLGLFVERTENKHEIMTKVVLFGDD